MLYVSLKDLYAVCHKPVCCVSQNCIVYAVAVCQNCYRPVCCVTELYAVCFTHRPLCIHVCYMIHKHVILALLQTCMLCVNCHTYRPVCFVTDLYQCMLCVTGLYVVSPTCMLCVDCHTHRPVSCVADLYVVCHWPICCATPVCCVLCVECQCHRLVCCVSQVCMLCITGLYVVSQTCMLCANCHTHRPVLCVSYHCHRLVCCVSTVTLSVSQTCILCVSDLYVVSQYLCHICHKPITVYVVSQTCRLCVTDLWVVCFVSQTEVQTAVQYWQDTLRVRATRAPIRLRRQCGSASVNYYKQRAYCVGQCAPVTVCGEIIIPQEHLEVSACVIVMLCKHLEVGV